MPPELTNLLPPQLIRLYRRGYHFRLITVAAMLGVFVVVAHAALLFPTYQFLLSDLGVREAELEPLRVKGAGTDADRYEKELNELTKSISRIESLTGSVSVVHMLAEILAIPHPKIQLIGMSYAAAIQSTPVRGRRTATTQAGTTITLSGIAATREDLSAYQSALQGSSLVAVGNLPFSVYTRVTDIPFSITLTLVTP